MICINVLSLFDGISCGQVALERAGIEVDTYYASEVDKYAIQITQKNYPKTIQLGNVEEWKTWNIDWSSINILIGGSPCQGFSMAGKKLNFDDPRSKLFFVYCDILNHIKQFNSNVMFLLENVKMKKEWTDVITERLGVEYIEINSALVSAQNRRRLYWTNIPNVEQPKDKNLVLKDIVLEDVCPVILHNLYGGFKEKTVRVFENKSPTLRTAAGGGHIPSIIKKDLFISPDKINSPVFKENYLQWDTKGKGHGSQDQRAYYLHKKHGTLPSTGASSKVKVLLMPEETVADFFKGKSYAEFKSWNCIRKLHPVECERLQTLPDNYTEGISDTQRYKTIGNGWTVDVIAHILSYLNKQYIKPKIKH